MADSTEISGGVPAYPRSKINWTFGGVVPGFGKMMREAAEWDEYLRYANVLGYTDRDALVVAETVQHQAGGALRQDAVIERARAVLVDGTIPPDRDLRP